jgi:hypothetical protein
MAEDCMRTQIMHNMRASGVVSQEQFQEETLALFRWWLHDNAPFQLDWLSEQGQRDACNSLIMSEYAAMINEASSKQAQLDAAVKGQERLRERLRCMEAEHEKATTALKKLHEKDINDFGQRMQSFVNERLKDLQDTQAKLSMAEQQSVAYADVVMELQATKNKLAMAEERSAAYADVMQELQDTKIKLSMSEQRSAAYADILREVGVTDIKLTFA